MVFELSDNPTQREIQLKELLERSIRCLAQLTAPIDFRYGQQLEEEGFRMYDKRELVFDYQPPSTRFAKFGNTNFTSLDFN